MSVPQHPEKLSQTSLLNAKDVIAQNSKLTDLEKVPIAAILTYQPNLIKAVSKRYRLKKFAGLYGDIHWLDKKKSGIVVASNFGIGAPVATVVLENLIALGVKHFISIGTAGSISTDLQVGDLVVCSKALRDEGTSHHYLPAAKFANPSEDLTSGLVASLRAQGYTHSTGPTWTTDAPYRETKSEIIRYRNEGILTVEMEAAALFAVGQFRKVEVAAAFAISDVADENGWRFDSGTQSHHAGLLNLFEAAVDSLS